MHEITLGFHRLFYQRTGPGAFTYRIEDRRWSVVGQPAEATARLVATGDVTGVRGKSDAVRDRLTRIGRETIGLRNPPLRPGHHIARVTGADITRTSTTLRMVTEDGTALTMSAANAERRFLDEIRESALGVSAQETMGPRFRTKKTVDRPARAFGEDASNRSEIRRRSNRAPGAPAKRPTTSTANWSARKAARP